MLFGYVRVSTKTQNPNLQVDALLKEGVLEKNLYQDVSSGAKAERHDLELMISKLREGDTVIVWKLDRIARSISHLLKLVDQFEKLGINFKSINDPFIDTTSAHGKIVITLFGAVAQLERDIIIECTTAGLKSARRRGIQFRT
jgi:DNA invertase Pin-like site-specific DNA recombinase